jgi:hypothetical protein
VKFWYLFRQDLIDCLYQPHIVPSTLPDRGCLQNIPILCLARGSFLAKSGETMVTEKLEPQLPDVSAMSY